MSLPSIFFISSKAEAANVVLNHHLPPDDVLELGGIDTLKLSSLWAILEGKPYEDEMMDLFEEIRASDDEWTDQIPSALTAQIAALEGVELDRVATDWAVTDEMRCDASGAKELLREIARLARRSIETQREFFLYTSL